MDNTTSANAIVSADVNTLAPRDGVRRCGRSFVVWEGKEGVSLEGLHTWHACMHVTAAAAHI